MRFTVYKLKRLERDVLQVDLARQASVDRTRLSLIENGHVTPRPSELERLAHALGICIEELQEGG